MRAKLLILGLICLFVFAYCESPADPEIDKRLSYDPDQQPQHFRGETMIITRFVGNDIGETLVIRWFVWVLNMTKYEARIVQVDKFIYYWDGDLYENEAEMPVLWTEASYYDPPLELPISYSPDGVAYGWKETDIDIPHPGYLPNRGKVIFHVESEGQIYILETELNGIIWY